MDIRKLTANRINQINKIKRNIIKDVLHNIIPTMELYTKAFGFIEGTKKID